MSPAQYIQWLHQYLVESRDNNTYDIDRVLTIKQKINSVITNGTQLEIPFPDYPDTVKLKTVYVSDSTSGKDTFTTFNYSENGTIY